MPTPTIDKPKSFRDRFYNAYGNPRFLQPRGSRGRQLVRDPSHRGYNRLNERKALKEQGSLTGRADSAIARGTELLTPENKARLQQTNPSLFNQSTPTPPQSLAQNGYQRPEVQALAQDPNLPPLEQALGQPRLEIGDTIPSPYAGQPYTRNDVFGRIEGMMSGLEDTQQRILDSQTPTEEEARLKNRISELNQKSIALNSFGEGTGVTQGYADRAVNKMRQEMDIERQQLTDQLQAMVDLRSAEVEAGKTELAFTQQNFSMLQSLQELTQPDVLETQINKATGDVYTVMRDPMSGEITTQKVGNVGAEATKKDYVSTGTYDTAQGKKFYGVTTEGTLEVLDLPGSIGESEGLSGVDARKYEMDLRKEFNSLEQVKQAKDVEGAFNRVNAGVSEVLAGNRAAGGQAVITSFNKLLDPGSVVREGEYARSEQGQSILNRLQGRINQASQGGVALTDAEIQQIASVTKTLYTDYLRSYNNEVAEYRRLAGEAGVKSENIAQYKDTAGLITKDNAKEGDIVILNGKPYQKTGDEFFLMEEESEPMDFSAANEIKDPVAIAEAIRQVESEGNYDATGESGENGAYQFMPDTWKEWAGKHLGNANAPMTQQNQDFVAQMQINEWLREGKTAEEIALLWNGGETKRKSGVNKFGVKYDSGAYADKVLSMLLGNLS